MAQKMCMFCGDVANTREHVIPQWMHNHFDIKHEKLRLRNGTAIKYMHEVVPACNSCNGIRFSQIEQCVKDQCASMQDLYVWGLKIYIGLNLKDSFLPESRRYPSAGTVLTKEESIKGVEFSKHILANYKKEGFTLYPNPFGSVFLVDLPQDIDRGFSLCSIGYPYNVLTISLTDSRLLTVILNDKGLTRKAIINRQLPDHIAVDAAASFSSASGDSINANTYAKFITFHYSRQKHRISIPSGIVSNSRRVAAIRMPTRIKVREHEDPRILADILSKFFDTNA